MNRQLRIGPIALYSSLAVRPGAGAEHSDAHAGDGSNGSSGAQHLPESTERRANAKG
jgi:hypothetical protein